MVVVLLVCAFYYTCAFHYTLFFTLYTIIRNEDKLYFLDSLQIMFSLGSPTMGHPRCVLIVYFKKNTFYYLDQAIKVEKRVFLCIYSQCLFVH